MPTKKPTTKNYIRLQITQIETDPLQFKPYKPTFIPPIPLFVDVPIEADEITESTPDYVTLSLAGFTAILANLADSMETMDETRRTHRLEGFQSRRRTR